MGVIRNGKYYHDATLDSGRVDGTISGIAASGALDRDFEDHAHDLIQPRLANGDPNPDFIEWYPEESKAHGFIEEEEE